MKLPISLLALALMLLSCKDSKKGSNADHSGNQDSVKNFFPVTAYIKGEVFNIKRRGINPIKYTTINEHIDSSWLKVEDLDSVVYEFLTPVIDSVNMVGLFTEKSFMDQSLNAVTLTYEPISTLPDSIQLTHWDVYINPQTQKVKRVYMVKEISNQRTLQLTWVDDQWFKIVTITNDAQGNAKVEKEEKIFWDF